MLGSPPQPPASLIVFANVVAGCDAAGCEVAATAVPEPTASAAAAPAARHRRTLSERPTEPESEAGSEPGSEAAASPAGVFGTTSTTTAFCGGNAASNGIRWVSDPHAQVGASLRTHARPR